MFFTQFSVSKGSFWAQQALFEQILTAEQKNRDTQLKQKLQQHCHTSPCSVLLYRLIYGSANPTARASRGTVIGTEGATARVHRRELPQFTYSSRTCPEELQFSSAVSP